MKTSIIRALRKVHKDAKIKGTEKLDILRIILKTFRVCCCRASLQSR